MDDKIFEKTLSGFVQDFANGDAIRHLADKGFTVPEIKSRLDFPASQTLVAKTVWEHFVATAKILPGPPETAKKEKVSYVKEIGEYGRVSFRQLREELSGDDNEYIPCDFGLDMMRDRKAFDEKLKRLDEGDREYVQCLPWPRARVWHVKDERMTRIMAIYKGE